MNHSYMKHSPEHPALWEESSSGRARNTNGKILVLFSELFGSMRTDGIGVDIQPNLKLEVAPARWPMLIGGVLCHVQVVAWVQFLAYSKIIVVVYPLATDSVVMALCCPRLIFSNFRW